MDQIKQIRQKGYAITSNEMTVGAMSIAVPIKNYTLPATLYILGPENRLKPRTSEFIEALLNSSKRISYNVEQIFKKK
jgi:DNA-binding IclR family transcriptional regulator